MVNLNQRPETLDQACPRDLEVVALIKPNLVVEASTIKVNASTRINLKMAI